MIPAFTIGMLGGCANGRSMARYFEEVASHYLRTFPRVRYLFSITTEQDRSVVRHLLECRPTLPGLEVAVILSSHQWDSHRCAATDERTAACNRIIDAADFCEVLPESKATLPRPALYRRFIERCDCIIFNEHLAGWALAGLFHAQVVQSGVPIPVQYGFAMPQYASFNYPPDRRDYLVCERDHFNPAAEYVQSVAYIERTGFSLPADRLPQIFLRKWLAAPPEKSCCYLMLREDLDTLGRLRDRIGCEYLSLKVFAWNYATRKSTKEKASEADAANRFMQFRTLLRWIAARREAGESVPPFDLWDFDAYDEALRTFCANRDIRKGQEI